MSSAKMSLGHAQRCGCPRGSDLFRLSRSGGRRSIPEGNNSITLRRGSLALAPRRFAPRRLAPDQEFAEHVQVAAQHSQ